MKSELTHTSYPKTINDLILLYKNKMLNLNPGFQRKSVWNLRDRKKLIESVLRNYPLPAIFLYKREVKGDIIYDVIDGKQRLESIFMFMGVIKGNRYSLKFQIDENKALSDIDWNILQKNNKQMLLTAYKLYTIEVDGDLSDIIDVFVRINSTGKALTSAEKQHAKYYNSLFLKAAADIANKYESFFIEFKVLSAPQISRMKHVELICEIMLSVGQNDVINKKAALDKIMSKDLTQTQVKKYKEQTIRSINRVRSMFPRLNETRFHQLSDFYCLVVLISQYEEEGLILLDKNRNIFAFELLKNFSNGIDKVRIKQKRAVNTDESEDSYREYLLTVLSGTDDITQRRRRLNIIDSLLRNLFEIKDKQRVFSKEQRRVIWNSTHEKKCNQCGIKLTWEDFTIDHKVPHSRGGKTVFENSSLLCRKHNSAKGNKPLLK